MAEDPTPDAPPDWTAIATQIASAILTQIPVLNVQKVAANAHADSKGTLYSVIHDVSVQLAIKMGETLQGLEEPFFPVVAGFVAPIVAGIFDASVNEGDFARKMTGGSGTAAAQSIVEGLMKAISGGASGEAEPSMDGSTRLASAAVQASLESSFNAIVPELLSDLLPEIGPHFTALTHLPSQIIRTLGVSRLVRQALRPLVDATCATPAKWYVAKQYRQTLLGATEAARQLARGRWSEDQVREELARAGYSDDRAEALLNSVLKFHSVADLGLLVSSDQWPLADAVQHLKDSGWLDEDASTEMLVEKMKQIGTFERQMATAAIDAYVAGRCDDGQLEGFCHGSTIGQQETAQLIELAHAKRALSLTPLSPAEVETCVLAGVLAVPDYTDALTRIGRTPDAVDALELVLRKKLDAKATVDALKAQQAADRATKQAAAIQKALDAKAAADAKAALSALGKPADIERAYIIGLVPIDRLEEIYDAQYPGDTAAILVGVAEDKRQTYLAQQTAHDDAAKRATAKGLNVGELEAAAAAGVLTTADVQSRLVAGGLSDADAGVIVATLTAKLADAAAAKTLHDQATAAAKVKHIDLAMFETLVRRGHRTLADYDALLSSLGYDDASRAAMGELLQLEIDDDATAAAARAASGSATGAKGLTLEQIRRGVILGVEPETDFTTFLIQKNYTSDAQRVLLAELRADVASADAARQKRAAADAKRDTPSLSLTTLAKAVRLGLVPIAVYQARLTADGYTADDSAIEMDLLTVEMGGVADATAQRTAANALPNGKGLTLSQTETAVKAGAASIEDYRAAATAAGLSADAVTTLVNLLQSELDTQTAAQQRADAIAAARGTKTPTLAEFETAVKDGLMTLDDFQAEISTWGYDPADVAMIVALLNIQLEKAAAKAGG